MKLQPKWVAVDWGTTNLRLWIMDADGRILDQRTSGRGLKSLQPEEFEEELLRHVSDLIAPGATLLALACGMVGAKTGWTDAGYRSVPCAPICPGKLASAKAKNPGLDVRIVPGLRQENPHDVMRGEETQISGAIRMGGGKDGAYCLPGTHSKWIKAEGGKVAGFATFMTGELFAAIESGTVVGDAVAREGWDQSAFLEGVERSAGEGGRLTGDLFGVRASALVGGMTPVECRSRLSGLLIGHEIRGAARFCESGEVTIIGESTLAGHYRAALESRGLKVRGLDAGQAALNGLRHIHRSLFAGNPA